MRVIAGETQKGKKYLFIKCGPDISLYKQRKNVKSGKLKS